MIEGNVVVSRFAWVRAVVLPIVVAAITLQQLTRPGYLLQVDAAFGLRTVPTDWSFYTPVHLLLSAGQWAWGGDVTGKLYVAIALFACGFAPMVLLRDRPWWAQGAAGAIGMLNPFVYDRIVEGQWGVVVATAGLFLFVAAWFELRRRPGRRAGAAVAGSALITLMFSADFAAIIAALVIGLAVTSSPWHEPAFRRWALRAGAVTLVLAMYGVISFFVSTGPSTYSSVARYSAADFSAFQATPAPDLGVVPALGGLYGEWSERLSRYFVADASYPWWWISTVVLVGLALVGAWLRRTRAWLLPLGAIGVAVSASTAVPPLRDALVAVAGRVPLVGAYREPQKWDALWLLAVVVLVAEASTSVGAAVRRRRRWIPAGPLIALAAVAATILPGGLVEIQHTADVVTPVSYPPEWYRAADYMRTRVPATATVAVLPWHLYETLPFVGRPTVDPASVFFPGRILQSQNTELAGQAADPVGAAAQATSGCALAGTFRSLDIHWALLLEDVPGGRDALLLLTHCGFTVVRDDGVTALLADGARP